jgi:hypothetical protein
MATLFARGSDGTACIFNGSNNVVDNPLVDLSRVLFHSNLDYPSVISTQDRSITLPARTTTPFYTIHTLFAHGRPGIPFVFGYITSLSNLSLAGSVPLDFRVLFHGRFVTLGANGSNVVLHEMSSGLTGSTTYDARSLTIRVHVTDLLL